MTQALIVVWIDCLDSLRIVEALRCQYEVVAALRMKVDECLVRVVEAARFLLLKQVELHLDDCLRGVDLVSLLRRDVVEDVLLGIARHGVADFRLLLEELAACPIEYERIDNAALQRALLAVLLVDPFASVADEAEHVLRDSGELLERPVVDVGIHGGEGEPVVAVCHEERGDGAGEATHVGA